MSELKPNQMSDWHIDGVAVHTADGTGLRGCITPTHPDFPAAVEALREENERLRNVLTFVACGYACVHYPDQDRDHSGIQYPDCVDQDIECCVADALRARELSR